MAAHFDGEVRTEWTQHPGDDRNMELMEDFAFVDAKGKTWLAPKGSSINGASIPEILWSIQGSPFVGDYRRASVIHDVYCDTESEPHKAVHRMFYDAMLCDGVGTLQAKKMFLAVRLFGPKWSMEALEDGALVTPEAGIAMPDGPPIEDLEAVLDQLLQE